MKKLAVLAMFCGIVPFATACTPLGGDFAVSWLLVSGDANTPIACEEIGADTIEVVSLGADGSEIVDLFDCIDGSGFTALLDAGNYDVFINVLDINGGLIAQSRALPTSLSDGETVTLAYEVSVDRGEIQLAWTIDGQAPAPQCAANDAGGVSVLATEVSTTEAIDSIFNCEDGAAVTTGHPLGQYEVSVSLLDSTDAAIAIAAPRPANLPHGNAVADLGVVNLEVGVFP